VATPRREQRLSLPPVLAPVNDNVRISANGGDRAHLILKMSDVLTLLTSDFCSVPSASASAAPGQSRTRRCDADCPVVMRPLMWAPRLRRMVRIRQTVEDVLARAEALDALVDSRKRSAPPTSEELAPASDVVCRGDRNRKDAECINECRHLHWELRLPLAYPLRRSHKREAPAAAAQVQAVLELPVSRAP
jgi:hypothetical protein